MTYMFLFTSSVRGRGIRFRRPLCGLRRKNVAALEILWRKEKRASVNQINVVALAGFTGETTKRHGVAG